MKHHRTNILETRLGIFLEGDISMVHIIYNNNVLILVYKRERRTHYYYMISTTLHCIISVQRKEHISTQRLIYQFYNILYIRQNITLPHALARARKKAEQVIEQNEVPGGTNEKVGGAVDAVDPLGPWRWRFSGISLDHQIFRVKHAETW